MRVAFKKELELRWRKFFEFVFKTMQEFQLMISNMNRYSSSFVKGIRL